MPPRQHSDLDSYEQAGFAFPVRVLPEHEASRLGEQHLAAISNTMRSPERVNPHLLFPWVDALCRAPPLLEAVSAVLAPAGGGAGVLLWESAWFLKRPSIGAATGDKQGGGAPPEFVSFHQDSTYLGLRHGGKLTTAWIALSESSARTGCLRVLSGSHRAGQLPHSTGSDPLNQLSKGQVVTVSPEESRAAVELVLQPGEASLHHERLVHASDSNTDENSVRLGLAVRYIAATEAPASPPDW